jgi:hypothetical protein
MTFPCLSKHQHHVKTPESEPICGECSVAKANIRCLVMRQGTLGAVEHDWDVPPEQEAILTFAAAPQMGKIYYRTAVAFKELGEKSEARKLLRVAAVYLPRDESVKKEIAECALRLG